MLIFISVLAVAVALFLAAYLGVLPDPAWFGGGCEEITPTQKRC